MDILVSGRRLRCECGPLADWMWKSETSGRWKAISQNSKIFWTFFVQNSKPKMLFLTARVDHTAEQIFKIKQLRQLVES